MELKQLEYFLAIVDHGGITGAGIVLTIAQPTISISIRAMERSLGVNLFHRVGRGMVLTSAGRALVAPARQILRDAAATKNMMTSTDEDIVGRVDILAMPMMGLGVLGDRIAEFRVLHPRVRFSVKEFNDDTLTADMIRDGHCEFVVTHIPRPASEQLDTIQIAEHEYWLAFPPGTDLPPSRITFDELPNIPLVSVPRDHSAISLRIKSLLESAAVGFHPSVAVQHRESRIPLVVAGVGFTFVERSVADLIADSAVVRGVDPPLRHSIGLVFDPTRLSAAGKRLVALFGTH